MNTFAGEHAELMGRIDACGMAATWLPPTSCMRLTFTANGQRVGPDGVKEALRRLRAAFSGMSYELREQIVAGDRLAVRWEHTGRHTGTWDSPIGKLAPTGKWYTISVIEISALRTGKPSRRGSSTTRWVCCDRSAPSVHY